MFSCTQIVRIRSNSPCLRVCYSYGFGRIDHVCKTVIRMYADESLVFASTLFVLIRTNSPC